MLNACVVRIGNYIRTLISALTPCTLTCTHTHTHTHMHTVAFTDAITDGLPTTDPTTSDTTQTTSTNFPPKTEDATMLASAAIVRGALGGVIFVLVILNVTIIVVSTSSQEQGETYQVIPFYQENWSNTFSVGLRPQQDPVQCRLAEMKQIQSKINDHRLALMNRSSFSYRETRSPNTLENLSEVHSESTAIAYEPIRITTLNPPNTYESIKIPDLEYAQADTVKGGYSNAEKRNGDMTQNIAYVENGTISLPETEDGYELVWL